MSSRLLPPNSTPLERALAAAMTHRLQFPIDRLWDPWNAPSAMLPWLAWQFRVVGWNDSWTESQRRRAIAMSVQLHRRLGTPWAMRQVFTLLELDGEYVEWREYGGVPHQYRLTVRLGQGAVPRSAALAFRDMVRSFSAARSTPEVVMSVTTALHGGRAAVSSIGQHIVSSNFQPATLAFNEDSLVG